MQVADVFSGRYAGALAPRIGRRLRLVGVMLLVLHLVAGIGWALDIITTDGQLYRDCTITQVEPDALRITHSNGAARLIYEKLPSALQRQYFDPARVAAYRQQLEEEKRIAAVKAEEERRQRQIAAAQAEEQREKEAEMRQREERVRQRVAADKQAAGKREEDLRALAKHRKTMFGVGLLAVGALLGFFVYFLPTIIGRNKVNSAAIFALNLFLGWTFFGWIVALVWACTEDSAMDRLARERLNARPEPPAPPRPFQEHGEPQLEDRRYLENGRYLE